ncbi:unnamed protein product [Owenia fusiformis]|uniref:Uncharacterized protein n=1 Tax=Owenia fusiformis TaxID=6347 RepID=A0A8S4P328_OWEFU|nr:unnamed protein product [Owenia fusiformis]
MLLSKLLYKGKKRRMKRFMQLGFILVVLPVLVLSQAGSRLDVCEEYSEDGTTVTYFACQAGPRNVIKSQKANGRDASYFNMTVEPGDMTCGLSGGETICWMDSDNPSKDPDKKVTPSCHICDARDESLSHPPSLMTDITGGRETYWQSRAWFSQNSKYNYPNNLHVNITLSFNKQYEFADDMNIVFATGRPHSMVLYKSIDYGATWIPLQYYNQDCQELYDAGISQPSDITTEQPDIVTCTEVYSGSVPLSGGTVKFPVRTERQRLYLGPAYTNYEVLNTAMHETNLSQFLTFTDLRLSLLYPATDGSEYNEDSNQLRKFSYGIADIDLTATCFCNLHAIQCMEDEVGQHICLCSHNTMGRECEQCLPLYNNRTWMPGHYVPWPLGTANECEKCECNNHSASCVYNATKGYGVCENCTHSTGGDFCELCMTGFYHNLSLPDSHPDTCINCDCQPLGVLDNNIDCTQEGVCTCKPLVEGRICDTCINEYYGLLLQEHPGECQACTCNLDGTEVSSNICEKQTGQCPCKTSTTNRTCNVCKDGYYDFPAGRRNEECKECLCDWGASYNQSCDKETGNCPCKPFTQSNRCDVIQDGYYYEYIDTNVYMPTTGTCTLSAMLQSDGNPFTGRSFMICSQDGTTIFEYVNGDIAQMQMEWSYYPVIRFTLGNSNTSSVTWTGGRLIAKVLGNSDPDVSAINPNLSPICQRAQGEVKSWDVNLTDAINDLPTGPAARRILKAGYPIEPTTTTLSDSSRRVFILEDAVILYSGMAVSFTMYAVNTNPIRLMIWRPVVYRETYQLVGEVWYTPTRVGEQEINLDANSTITVAKGDLVGFLKMTTVSPLGYVFKNVDHQMNYITLRDESDFPQVGDIRSTTIQGFPYRFALRVNYLTGFGEAWFSNDSVALDARCKYSFTLSVGTSSDSTSSILIDAILLLPDIAPFTIYQQNPNQQSAMFDCLTAISPLNNRPETIAKEECRALMYSVSTELHNGGIACNCDPVGSIANATCENYGGQCKCKPGVFGRACDQCLPGYYNFTEAGCEFCPTLVCEGDPLFDSYYGIHDDNISLIPIILIGVFGLLLVITVGLIIILVCKRRAMQTKKGLNTGKDNISYVDIDIKDPKGIHAYNVFTNDNHDDQINVKPVIEDGQTPSNTKNSFINEAFEDQPLNLELQKAEPEQPKSSAEINNALLKILNDIDDIDPDKVNADNDITEEAISDSDEANLIEAEVPNVNVKPTDDVNPDVFVISGSKDPLSNVLDEIDHQSFNYADFGSFDEVNGSLV